MKKKLFFFAAIFMSMAATSQVLEVLSVHKLQTPPSKDVKVAGISPKGDYILLTDNANKGLVKFDLASETASTISEASGAGYNVKISQDGQEIVYRETTVGADNLRRQNIVRHNFATRRRAMIAKSQRDMVKMQTSDMEKVITINNCLMQLTQNGESKTIAPNGDKCSYIWPSISPDGSKICYYVCGQGCFVCNIDGTDPIYIAHDCRAAKWYGNDIIIAMEDHDDGHFTTSSAIVAFNLKGQKQVLTDNSMIAMYPYAIEGAVVFATDNGETYIMNVK